MRKRVKNNVSWVGFIDWELDKFHGDDYSIYNGSSQNAYLIEEEKTVLIDTIWTPHRFEFVENLEKEIDLKKIDFIVANHGECDHSGALVTLMEKIPDTPIYCTAQCVKSIEGQYGKKGWNFKVVKTGDEVEIGNGKKLTFIEMPMLHWPDSMATFMSGDNILFSNDCFGQHFAVEELFNDKADMNLVNKEAMKYFTNIINPYAMMASRKLDEIKKMNLNIEMIVPSHGVIWRDNPLQIIEKYEAWSNAYQENQITIVYDTMWEGCTRIALDIASKINELDDSTVVKVFNISKYDKNEIMMEVFKSKAIVVGSPTAYNDILSSVSGWLAFLKQLKFKNKKAACFGTYGWSGESVKILKEKLKDSGFDVVDEEVKCLWKENDSDSEKIEALVRAIL